MKSKVMEELEKKWRDVPLNGIDDYNFIESQIRAAIKEFAEMIRETGIRTSRNGIGITPISDEDLYKLIAAFGVEAK